MPPAPKKILIVEDEPEIAQLVKLYLEKEGFHTNVAKSGVEALKLTKSERPDLLILDLMLPEIDGIEVCKKIRNEPNTALLPIIMLTAKAGESDSIIGLELGADDYVTKPFSPKALVARVKALFRRLERTDDSKRSSFSFWAALDGSLPTRSHREGRRGVSHCQRIRPARTPTASRWARADTRCPTECNMGLRLLWHHANRGCAYPPAEAEDPATRGHHHLGQVGGVQAVGSGLKGVALTGDLFQMTRT